jgi:hypothetical protein
MLREDNNGFIYFPNENRLFTKSTTGKTFVYLVSFDAADISNKPYVLSNVRLNLPGEFVTDDITSKRVKYQNLSLNDFIEEGQKTIELESRYFPNTLKQNDIEKIFSIPFTSCICIGWSENTFEFREDKSSWFATFKDLSHEGKKLYYSIKKLHNNKEVRILTFNNI